MNSANLSPIGMETGLITLERAENRQDTTVAMAEETRKTKRARFEQAEDSQQQIVVVRMQTEGRYPTQQQQQEQLLEKQSAILLMPELWQYIFWTP